MPQCEGGCSLSAIRGRIKRNLGKMSWLVNVVAPPSDHDWHQPIGGDMVGNQFTLSTAQQM